MRVALAALALVALVAAKPAHRRAARPAAPSVAPALLAQCSDVKGKVFAVAPRHGWDNDRMAGSLTIMRTAKGGIDILVNDHSIVEPGTVLKMTHQSADYAYFIVTGTYRQSRVDTWQVTFEPGGTGRLLWSSLSTHMPPNDATQGMLYSATCTR